VKRIERLERQIVPVLKNHDVVRAGLFGSTVRGEARKGSDIDILVEFRGTKSLLDLARLEIELERNLKRKVDVLTYNSLHPLLRETILKEEARII
jgi:predicted nucleotidyltransferase